MTVMGAVKKPPLILARGEMQYAPCSQKYSNSTEWCVSIFLKCEACKKTYRRYKRGFLKKSVISRGFGFNSSHTVTTIVVIANDY